MLRLPNSKCQNHKVQGAAATATATAVVVVAAAAAASALWTHKYATLSCKQARQAARQEGNVVVVEGEAAGLLAPTHSERERI